MLIVHQGGGIIKFNSSVPIYLQVIDDIKSQIATSKIASGEKLPSSRELAIQYGINPNTASRVYKEMELANLCFTKRGLGTYVTEDENVIASIKTSMAKIFIQNYVSSMESLGYSKNDMIEMIKKGE